MPTLTRFDIGTRSTGGVFSGRDAIPFLLDRSLEIEPQLNGRMRGTCTIIDRLDRENALFDIFRPEKRQAFLIEFDDGRRFGGVIWDILERGYIIPTEPSKGIYSRLALVDYSALLDVVPFNEPVAGGTLKSQLEAVIPNLTEHGITLASDQVDGPTVDDQAYIWKTHRDIYDHLSKLTDYVYAIDADAVFRMFAPGTLTAPQPITEADGNHMGITFRESLNDYRNEVWIRYGPQGLVPVTETFTGDGSTRTFALSYELVPSGSAVTTSGFVTVTRTGPAVTEEDVDQDPAAGTAAWHFDAAAGWNNAIVQDGAEVVLAAGETVSITYLRQLPGAVLGMDVDEREEAGPFTTVMDRPDVTSQAIAQSIADAEVRRLAGDNARLTIRTMDPGYEVGQTLELDCPILGFQGETLITEMRMLEVVVDDDQLRHFLYELTAIQGNVYRENWMAFWRGPREAAATGGTPTLPPAGCRGEVVWSDAFESAAALSADYTVVGTPAKTAGAGDDGSQAVTFPTPGTHSIRRAVTMAGRQGCVSMDVRVAAGGRFTVWILSGGNLPIDCATGLLTGAPAQGFSTFYYNLMANGSTAAGLYTDGVWFSFRLLWQISTFVGPGVNDHALDGYVRLYIDEALVWSVEDVKVGWPQASQVVIDAVRIFGLDARIDNLVIRDGA